MKTKSVFLSILFIASIQFVFAQRSYIHRAIEEKNERDHGDAGKSKLNGWLDNVNNVTLRPNYTFNQSVTYTISKYSRGKWAVDYDMVFYYNAKELISGFRSLEKKNHVITVMDVKPRINIGFNTDDKICFAMNINAFTSKKRQDEIANGDGDIIDEKIKPTGKTKVIMGYTCKEYIKKNDAGDMTHQFWIASTSDILGYGTLNFEAGVPKGKENQVILEVTHYFHNQPKENIVATSINRNENMVIKTSDYTQKAIGHIN